MAKKIYDIKPPKVVRDSENGVKSIKVSVRKKKNSVKSLLPATPKIEKKRFPLKEIIFGGSIIIFLLGAYLYNKLPRADVQIWPKVDILTLQQKVTADKNVDTIDITKKVMPAKYLEVSEDSWQKFQATGVASNDSKASGTIKIYNKISPSTPFTLKAGTHFLSDSGKYFVTLAKVTIPAAKGKTPGAIDVKVQAEEVGPDHNIGSSKFSVPKLYGTAYYYSIWAESKTAMAGGYTGTVKKVSSDDIAQAKSVLTKKLLDQAENSLKSKISEDDVLLDGAISREVIDASSDVKPGLVADTFNESARVMVSALIFKRQDLEKFVKEYISSQLSESQNFLEKSLDINYKPDLIDIKKGSETINLTLSVKTYYIIDKPYLIDALPQKSAEEIKQIINQKYEGKISEVKTDFWPFWVNQVPTNKKRIMIDLNFE